MYICRQIIKSNNTSIWLLEMCRTEIWIFVKKFGLWNNFIKNEGMLCFASNFNEACDRTTLVSRVIWRQWWRVSRVASVAWKIGKIAQLSKLITGNNPMWSAIRGGETPGWTLVQLMLPWKGFKAWKATHRLARLYLIRQLQLRLAS